MSVVSVRGLRDYDPRPLRLAMEACLQDLGGLEKFVKPGQKVLLKPNLLRSAKPEEAVVTHPQLVAVVAEMILDIGAVPALGDSPPIGHLARVLTKSGYDEFMARLGVEAAPFKEKVTVDFPENRLFKKIELAKEIFEYDVVINLAKVKTHTQMGLTLAVKNLFGAVLGTDKAAWHMRAGKDFDTFATALVQIYERINPSLSILDGVLAMEGNGPNSGVPRPLEFIAASSDAVALDAVVCSMVGYRVENLRTCVIAQKLGIGVADLERIEVKGDKLPGFPLHDFEPPRSVNMAWNLSSWNPIRKFMENHMVTKPDIDPALCENCGICKAHCPPQAISEHNGAMRIDRNKCISCFCCHELCGNEAVTIRKPFWGRVINKLTR